MVNADERERRAAERAKLKAKNQTSGRPGIADDKSKTEIKIDDKKIRLSNVRLVSLGELSSNPLNKYPPLTDDEIKILSDDVKEKGVLVPLIVRETAPGSYVIIAGHNRKRAAEIAGLTSVPVQAVVDSVTREIETEIMISENERRRGGGWTAERKRAFVKKYVKESKHGGARVKGQTGGDQAEIIRKDSGGNITKGTAKRIIADIRKNETDRAVSVSISIPAKYKKLFVIYRDFIQRRIELYLKKKGGV